MSNREQPSVWQLVRVRQCQAGPLDSAGGHWLEFFNAFPPANVSNIAKLHRIRLQLSPSAEENARQSHSGERLSLRSTKLPSIALEGSSWARKGITTARLQPSQPIRTIQRTTASNPSSNSHTAQMNSLEVEAKCSLLSPAKGNRSRASMPSYILALMRMEALARVWKPDG